MSRRGRPPRVGDMVFYHFETLPEDRETGRKPPVWVGWVAGVTGSEWDTPMINIVWQHSMIPGGHDVSWRDFQLQSLNSMGRGYELIRATDRRRR